MKQLIDVEQRRIELGERFRDLRRVAGMSSRDVARKTGISQSKVLRFERGVHVPTGEEADLLFRSLKLTQEAGNALRIELLMLDMQHVGFEILLDSPQRHYQADLLWLTETASDIVSFSGGNNLPGLLQTADYTRAITKSVGYSEETKRDALAQRVLRQQMLYDPGKHFRLIMSEAALRARYVSVASLRVQYNHLLALGTLDNVELGVLPLDAYQPAAGYGHFILFDESYAWVDGPVCVGFSSSGDIERFKTRFTELSSAAIWGAEAAEFVRRLERQLADGPLDLDKPASSFLSIASDPVASKHDAKWG